MFFSLCRRLWTVWLFQNLDRLPCEFQAILNLSPSCCRLASLLGLWALRCICLPAVTHPRGLDAPAGLFHSFSPPPLPASSVDNAMMGSALCPALMAELMPWLSDRILQRSTGRLWIYWANLLGKHRWIYAFQECGCSYASWLWNSKEINKIIRLSRFKFGAKICSMGNFDIVT